MGESPYLKSRGNQFPSAYGIEKQEKKRSKESDLIDRELYLGLRLNMFGVMLILVGLHMVL